MPATADDSDLEDLLSGSSPKQTEMTSLNSSLDRLSGNSGPTFVSPIYMVTASCRLCFYSFPRLAKCLCFLLVLGAIGFISNTLFNPVKPMGKMGGDYSAIKSAYELKINQVDHWCIQGDNESCKCEDPLEAASRSEFKSWNSAHKANVAEVNMYRTLYGEPPGIVDEQRGKPRPPIDVAFIGESVVEAMDGRWLGKKVVRAISRNSEGEDHKRPDIGKVFEKLFNKENGGPLEGVALGIAGDSCANVLWRIQHDEMPYDFNPKVFWLVLGMNDLTRMQCSEEIVVLGILRVAEEIRLRKPDAKIVINSLLPMIDYQRNDVRKKKDEPVEEPKMEDFADFKAEKNDVKESQAIKEAKAEFAKDKESNNRARFLRRLKARNHDEEAEGKDRGADLEKAMERKRKYLEARDKRLRERTFKDDEKYRAKKPGLLPAFQKRVLPPVWPAVHLINDKLKEFCQKHEGITFFDATPIFSRGVGQGKHRLQNDLISPRGHPSELGFAVWEGAIMHRLHKMLLNDKPVRLPKPRPAEEEVSADDDDQVPQKPDILKPVTQDANIDEIEADDDDSEGEEHVSEGKIAEPPAGNEDLERPDGGKPVASKKKGGGEISATKAAEDAATTTGASEEGGSETTSSATEASTSSATEASEETSTTASTEDE